MRDGDEYVLNGNKTFITNGPYADTVVFYAKLDDGNDTTPRNRKVLTFVLDRGLEGLGSPTLPQDGVHSYPTGELFCSDVRVGPGPPPRRDRGQRGVAAVGRAPRTTSSPSGPGWPPCRSA